MSTIVGHLRAVLGLDSSAFQSGLQQSQSSFRSFGLQMATIGAGVATAGAAAFAAFNNSANRMTDLQRQADIAGLSIWTAPWYSRKGWLGGIIDMLRKRR